MEFRTAEDIGKLIELTLSLAIHKLSYDEGGIINALEKYYDKEMKDAVIEQISEMDEWKSLLKVYEELYWKKEHPMAFNHASFEQWVNDLLTTEKTDLCNIKKT